MRGRRLLGIQVRIIEEPDLSQEEWVWRLWSDRHYWKADLFHPRVERCSHVERGSDKLREKSVCFGSTNFEIRTCSCIHSNLLESLPEVVRGNRSVFIITKQLLESDIQVFIPVQYCDFKWRHCDVKVTRQLTRSESRNACSPIVCSNIRMMEAPWHEDMPEYIEVHAKSVMYNTHDHTDVGLLLN